MMRSKKVRIGALLPVLALLWALVGCVQTPGQRAVNPALHDPNSDYVSNQVQLELAKRGGSGVAENWSQVPTDGWMNWWKEKTIVRNPDDTIFTIEMPNGVKMPLYEQSESIAKWNLTNTLSGLENTMSGIGELEFSHGDVDPNTTTTDSSGQITTRCYAARRGGFFFRIKSLVGGIGADSTAIQAKYEGQAKVKAAIGASLGTVLEQHWLGKQGLLKIAMDGTATLITETGKITGQLIKLSPMGAASSGLDQVAVTIREKMKDGNTKDVTEVVTEPKSGK